ncbi:hypothetical protein STENM223S_07576 [Streptomyces tendae]
MCAVKSRRTAGTSCQRSITVRYSWRVVSRPATPVRQPSTRASDQVQASAPPHTASSSGRHGSRAATPGPYATTATATASTAGVPGPRCGIHWPTRGGQPTRRVP